jgi:hypothetical protein
MWEPLTVEGLIATALKVATWGLDDSKRDDLREYVIAARDAITAETRPYGLPAWHGYFDGNPSGFQFTMPGYALSGPTEERYDTVSHRWVVTHTSGNETWVGVGQDRVAAYLDLIAVRCNVDVFAQPRRGDTVEAFLKRHRDRYEPGDPGYFTLDVLLDDYRLHSDTGADLTVEEDTLGPHAGRG